MTARLNIVAADGQPLGGDVLEARGEPRAIVILLHAMMADRRAFRGDRGLPGVLAADGCECWLADFRGRGRSPAASFIYDDLVRYDVPAFVSAARARGLPVAIVGHSLGAHVALAAAAQAPADAYVLLAGNVWLPGLDPSRRRRLARSVAMHAFLAASARGTFPARALRIGVVDEPRAYVSDLVRFWRSGRWGSRDGVDYLEALARVDAPVLAMTGAGDQLMAHAIGAATFARHLPRSEFRVVGRQTGFATDPGHMGLVTDSASRPAWEAVSGWLTATFTSP